MSAFFKPKFSLNSPYLDHYFGLWMIHEESFQGMVNQVQGMNLTMHLQSPDVKQFIEETDHALYEVDSAGIATFHCNGPMMKAVPSMASGSSYVRLRQQINAARRDPEVLGGLLMIDTPGGTSRGNEDLANDVRAFAKAKPIIAFTEDMTCSAGVSVASQCTKRFANNATAMYGAMGTFVVLQDTSGIAEKLGVKIHVIKAGDSKGDGVPGTEVTTEQIAEWQRIVNQLNDNYLGLIASGLGRTVDQIRPFADGRVIFASDAVAAGLIDGVQTIDQTIDQLRGMLPRNKSASFPSSRTGANMAAETSPASLQELKQTFPNSTADWRESQLEAGNDMTAASVAYAKHVEAAATAEREEHAKALAKAKETAPAATSPGHQPLTENNVSGASMIDSGDPVQDFEAAVQERLPKGRSPTWQERQSAIRSVATNKPQLHQAYVAAGNTSKKAQRLLQEKYEDVTG